MTRADYKSAVRIYLSRGYCCCICRNSLALVLVTILIAGGCIVNSVSAGTRFGRRTSSLADIASLDANSGSSGQQLMTSTTNPLYMIDEASNNVVGPFRDLDLTQFDRTSNNVQAHLAARVLAENLRKEASKPAEVGDNDLDLMDDKQSMSLLDQKRDFFPQLLTAAKRVIAPSRNYYHLVKRYKNWYKNYNDLKSVVESEGSLKMRTSSDVIRIEYAKLDKLLMERACEIEPELRGHENELESVDFVLQILRILIGELESIEKKLERSSLDEDILNQLNVLVPAGDQQQLAAVDNNDDNNNNEDNKSKLDETQMMTSDDDVKRALNRAKRIAIQAVGSVALTEALNVAKLSVFNAVARHIVENRQSMDAAGLDPRNNVLNYLEPIVLLLGSPSSSLVVSYLRNVQFRASLALVSHSFNMILACPRPKRSAQKKFTLTTKLDE